jgi:hypothetical protein
LQTNLFNQPKEMKIFLRWLMVFALIFFRSNVNGQVNLLKNGNFEVTNPSYNCHYYYLFSPNFFVIPGPVQFLSSPNLYTPDYFNSCVTDTTGNNYPGLWVVSVPKNRRCFQNAKSGSGYVGIVNWDKSNNGKEYITIDFFDTLHAENDYYFEVSCNQSAWHGYFSNDIAALFHNTLIQETSINTLEQFNPQIVNNGNIIDTLNWNSFSGIFHADGGEKYITIGNFKNYLNNPDTIKNPWWHLSPDWLLNDPNDWDKGNYILLDDAWLIELPEISLPDTVKICSGEAVELNADTAGFWEGVSGQWFPANGLSNPFSFHPIATPTQTTTYYLTLMDTGRFAHALAGIIDSVTVIVNTDSKNITLSNDTSVCKGDTLQVSVSCSDCGSVIYHWAPEVNFLDAHQNPALLSVSNNVEVFVNIESTTEKICFTGNHPINITIKNEEDCIDLDSDEINIPNSITPGKFWIISGLENPVVSIWDGRGRLIYFSNDYKNDFVAKEAQGIYFYKVNSFGISYSGKLIISP